MCNIYSKDFDWAAKDSNGRWKFWYYSEDKNCIVWRYSDESEEHEVTRSA